MHARLVVFCSLSTVVATAVSADPIGRLAGSAYCREESGKVRQPQVRPEPQAEAARVARGMIKTAMPVECADCFFYLSEVAFGSPTGCSTVNVGADDRKVAGTLSQSCSER